ARSSCFAQLVQPLLDSHDESPRAPPSGQRSCCEAAATSPELVGFTATCGSTSVLSYAASKSADAPKGQPVRVEGAETTTSAPTRYGSAAAVPAAAAATT